MIALLKFVNTRLHAYSLLVIVFGFHVSVHTPPKKPAFGSNDILMQSQHYYMRRYVDACSKDITLSSRCCNCIAMSFDSHLCFEFLCQKVYIYNFMHFHRSLLSLEFVLTHLPRSPPSSGPPRQPHLQKIVNFSALMKQRREKWLQRKAAKPKASSSY